MVGSGADTSRCRLHVSVRTGGGRRGACTKPQKPDPFVRHGRTASKDWRMNEIWTGAWWTLGVVGIALLIWLYRRRRPRRAPMARLTTRYEGIWYTHRLLWQIVEQQAAFARERDRE